MNDHLHSLSILLLAATCVLQSGRITRLRQRIQSLEEKRIR